MTEPQQQRRFAPPQTRTLPSIPPAESGYGALVLERLARQVCRTAGVDWSCIFVRDRQDPRAVIAAAGQGMPWEVLGARFGVDEGMIGEVLSGGGPLAVEDYSELVRPLVWEEARGHSAVAVPITWNRQVGAVLTAADAAPQRTFGPDDLMLLAELAELAAAALEQSEDRLQMNELMQAHVVALAAAMDMRDRRTARHSEDVVRLALCVGELMHLEPASLLELEFAARLHDVGKIRVPDAVLHKPGPLNHTEYDIIRCHSAWGAETLASIPGLQAVAAVVRFHHERWDGTGYPDGLRGARIPLASRIICVCDAYAAMTADRPYRPAMSPEDALNEVRQGSGTQFDPMIVSAVAEVVEGA
ncbi:MAG: HD domain-containing protein [Actinobacteria bacterium]|nr:HD domain-containing protein [Actinomycetota bacterium]